MFDGSLISTPEKVTIPFGLYRIWNNGASLEWVYANNWFGFDQAIQFGQRLGVELLYVLAGEPKSTLPTITAWREFVTTAVLRAESRIRYWELLNEPAYLNHPPGVAFAYAMEASKIIKALYPEAVVISPSFNELQRVFEKDYAHNYIDLMAAMGHNYDVIAYHSYSGKPKEDRDVLLSLLRPHGGRLPNTIWLTETDLTPSQIEQLAGVVECVVQNAQEGGEDYDANVGKGKDLLDLYNRLRT